MLAFSIVGVFSFARYAMADSEIQINSIPDDASYLPTDSHISIWKTWYELNDTKTKVRQDVRYVVVGDDDDETGPGDTQVEIPGLVYDAGSNAIVYQANGKTTVCANHVSGHLVWFNMTGLCKVTGRYVKHTDNSGFNPRKYESYDVFFVVRDN